MLPLRDTVPARRLPAAVWALVFINAAVFLHEMSLPPRALEAFIYRYALIPADVSSLDGLVLHWPTLITSMFLHGGWLHLIGNMWFLWIFGDNVEDRFGTAWFLPFYFVGGLAATLLQVAIDPTSRLPSLGASGAIAAVLGAYIVLFPTARVVTLVPVLFIPLLFDVPALVWIGIWFIEQALNGLASLLAVPVGGVAWWAHIGGFLFGVIATVPKRAAPERTYRHGYDREWPYV